MTWKFLRRARRAPVRRACPSVGAGFETLEDRVVPDASGFFANLSAAQSNQAALAYLNSLAHSNPQAAVVAAQLAEHDFAIEQLIYRDLTLVRSHWDDVINDQVVQLRESAMAELGATAAAFARFAPQIGALLAASQEVVNHFQAMQGQAVANLVNDLRTPSFDLQRAMDDFVVMTAPPTPAVTATPTTATAATGTSGSQQSASAAPTSGTTATGDKSGTAAGTTSTTPATKADGTPLGDPLLVSLHLKPLDINLLGLRVQSNDITVNVSAQPGSGELLGNLLTVVGNLVNLQGTNAALNNVLGSVVDLLNGASLAVSGVGSGTFDTAPAATTPVLDLSVAPVHLNLLGVLVDTTPIHLTITAHSGQGLVLGNVITDLANLFNPPLPKKLNLDDINSRLVTLLNQLNAQIPGIAPSPSPPAVIPAGSNQILSLNVAPINVNLLGLVLKTDQIQVNADATPGNGNLLGNVLQTLLNTLGATPQNLTALSNNLNAILAKVVGVLNASSLTLSAGAVGSLTQVLQTLALPDLVNTTGQPATAPVLNLVIASPDGTTPPVNVNLLGLTITTSNVHAQLIAQTGQGQVLGNLVYNVAHLLDPGGTLNLLTILNQLGL